MIKHLAALNRNSARNSTPRSWRQYMQSGLALTNRGESPKLWTAKADHDMQRHNELRNRTSASGSLSVPSARPNSVSALVLCLAVFFSAIIATPAFSQSGQILSITTQPLPLIAGQTGTIFVAVSNTGSTGPIIVNWVSPLCPGWTITPTSVNPVLPGGSNGTYGFNITPPAAGGSCTITWQYWKDNPFPLSNTLLDTETFAATSIVTPIINDIPNASAPCGTSYNGPQPTMAQGTPPFTWTLVNGQSGMTINPNTGVVSWNPTIPGSHPITIRATNAAGNDTELWTLTVNPTAPAINPIGNATIPCGNGYTGPIPSLTNQTCMAPVTWTLVTSPPGMTINSATGVVSWNNPTSGVHPITIRASNSSGNDTEDWNLTVSAISPVITAIPDASYQGCGPYMGPTPTLTNPNCMNPVTWTIVTGPGGMTIGPGSGIVIWPSPTSGSHTITIRASNSAGNDTETWQLSVPLPDLSMYQPSGWPAPLVVSVSPGTHTNDTLIYDNQPLYIDWAVANLSSVCVPTNQTFFTQLYIDGSPYPFFWTHNGLPNGTFTSTEDFVIEPLPAGPHTITIRTDTGNLVSESNESNNETSRNIIVLSTQEPPELVVGSLTMSPALAQAGQTVTATFVIHNPNATAMQVCRGLSIHLGDDQYVDIAPWLDLVPSSGANPVVTVQSGTASYAIQYIIPSNAYAGPYTVRYRLWPVTGGACDYSGISYDVADQYLDLHVRKQNFGTTVITHGFNGDRSGWPANMAKAIVDRAGGQGTVLKYDPASGAWKTLTGMPASLDPNYEIVLVFDWVEDSDFVDEYNEAGSGEGAADALYAALRNPKFVASFSANTDLLANSIHFIGHSRGAVVNSEVIQRLYLSSSPIDVEHVTTLDPHPVNGTFNRPVDWLDPFPLTWSGVDWADNYWRADADPFDFDGMPIEGACNLSLEVLKDGDFTLEHTKVHAWYHGTIKLGACDDGANDDCADGESATQIDPVWYTALGFQEGFHYSDIVGAFPGLTQDCPRSMAPQGQKVDPADSCNPMVGELPVSIYNGDFELGADAFAGWKLHGGGTDFDDSSGDLFSSEPSNIFLRLGDLVGNNDRLWQKHNRLWIDNQRQVLAFSMRVVNPSSDDRFQIWLHPVSGGNSEKILDEVWSSQTGWLTHLPISVPNSLQGKTCVLELKVAPIGGLDLTIDVDDLTFAICATPAVPEDVDATDGTRCDGVEVTWNDVTGASCYEIWRNGAFLAIDPDCASPYLDSSAFPGIVYGYRLRATNNCGAGNLSSDDAGYRQAVLLPPGPVTASDGSCDQVVISWQTAPGASTYEIRRDGDLLCTVSTSPCVDFDPAIGESYTYEVRAINECGMSDPVVDTGWARACSGILSVPDQFKTIQEAIDAVSGGSVTIEVTEGDYYGPVVFNEHRIHLKATGSIENTKLIGVGGRVLEITAGNGADTIIEGFTISRGNATGTDYSMDDKGGGMLIVNSSPTIRNCIFKDNVAGASGGGAIFALNGSPVIENCCFFSNQGGFGGALNFIGLPENHSTPQVKNCKIIGNHAVDVNNLGIGYGGALAQSYCDPVIINTLMVANIAAQTCGAISSAISNPTLINCTIAANQSSNGPDGGICSSGDAVAVTVANSILWGNLGTAGSNEDSQIKVYNGGTGNLNYNLVQGWTGTLGGAGNIDGNPRFANLAGVDGVVGTWDDDGHILPASVCIDAGNSALLPGDITEDLYDNPRRVDDLGVIDTGAGAPPVVDIGVHEHQIVSAQGDCNGDGLVNVDDLLCVINGWGVCPQWPEPCSCDHNHSGTCNVDDLLMVINNWSP